MGDKPAFIIRREEAVAANVRLRELRAIEILTRKEKKRFAAYVVKLGNNRQALEAAFGDKFDAENRGGAIKQLLSDPVVKAEVAAIVNMLDAKHSKDAPDLRAMAVLSIRWCRTVIAADFDTISAMVLGKTAAALDDIPLDMRSVIKRIKTKIPRIGGVPVIESLEFFDKDNATQRLQSWAAMAAEQNDEGASVVSMPVESLPVPMAEVVHSGSAASDLTPEAAAGLAGVS